jgi:hypothetical protein
MRENLEFPAAFDGEQPSSYSSCGSVLDRLWLVGRSMHARSDGSFALGRQVCGMTSGLQVNSSRPTRRQRKRVQMQWASLAPKTIEHRPSN